MPDLPLDVREHLTGIGLVPVPVQVLGHNPKLDNQIAGQVLWVDLAPLFPPEPEERGFKDTVKANPGQFTTIRAKFDLPTDVTAPQNYVYHCHIVEHEDNDMMRPFTVMP